MKLGFNVSLISLSWIKPGEINVMRGREHKKIRTDSKPPTILKLSKELCAWMGWPLEGRNLEVRQEMDNATI
jgi:hypothetical protein